MTAEPKVVTCPNCGKRNRVAPAAKGAPRCGNCRQALPWVVDAGDDDFAEVADQATVPVLVDLWAPWCGPCRMVSPVLEQMAAEKAGELKLVKVNADDAPSVSRRFEAQAIPTLVVLRNGQVIARQVGAAPAAVLRPWLDEALAKQEAS
ncbi:MAG TPA: thioredoxin [Kribbellaceae bacterium]|nr:thioredoxin [Kribbellaceae bacterium]